MKCLNRELLQNYSAGELSPAEADAVARHVAECSTCGSRLRAVRERSAAVAAALRSLAPTPADAADASATGGDAQSDAEAAPDVSAAWRHFAARLDSAERAPRPWLLPRPAWIAAAAALAIALITAFAPVRTWADGILALFRVQRFQALPLDVSRLPRQPNAQVGEMIQQLLSSSVSQLVRPGPPVGVPDAATAARLVGFPVRLPADATPAWISVHGENAFQLTLDRDRLKGVLDEIGRSDLQLPRAMDGAVVKVDIPPIVVAAFGTCPRPKSQPGLRGSMDPSNDCVIITQLRSPVVAMPPGVDLNQLADVGLQVAGMTPDQAQTFTSTVDWTSTLVVPFPAQLGSSQQVGVDGAQGLLIGITPGQSRPQSYALMWAKSGVVYSINGVGDGTQALSLAASLQ
jgi:hypothetical protein